MRLARLIRNRVIGLVRRARRRVADISPRRQRILTLVAMRRRLELLLGAMFDVSVGDGIMPQGPAAKPNERSILLPPWIPDNGDAAEQYRLLAIEQGGRIARGTRLSTPADPLERDLYTILAA